jgi:hypothetical protein
MRIGSEGTCFFVGVFRHSPLHGFVAISKREDSPGGMLTEIEMCV